MLQSSDLESRHFSFRLFLDDYSLNTSQREDRVTLSAKSRTPFNFKLTTSDSPKVYYNELEELDTFCCIDDDNSSKRSDGKNPQGSFSLLNLLPKRESSVFSDFLSILSRKSGCRNLETEELLSGVSNAHFERLREKLAQLASEANDSLPEETEC